MRKPNVMLVVVLLPVVVLIFSFLPGIFLVETASTPISNESNGSTVGSTGDAVMNPDSSCAAGASAATHRPDQNCFMDAATCDAVSGDTMLQQIDQEYDQLSAMLQRHYQQYLSQVGMNDIATEGSFHKEYYRYRVNLSPKVDSSLVRSQQHKLLPDCDATNCTLANKQPEGTTTSTDSTTGSDSDYQNQKLLLDVKNLTRVINVNCIDYTVTVQARCTYDRLVKELMNDYKMIPLVVPEFKSITIGGAIVGGALESSSFLYGQVSDTVVSMTVLLPNGTRTTITEQTHSELYHAIPGSYGSLVIILDATIRVRPIVSNFVQLQLSTYESIEDGIDALQEYNWNSSLPSLPEFVDAIQYPNGDFVIISGNVIPPSANESCITSSPLVIRTEDPSSKWFYECIYDLVHVQDENNKKSTTLSTNVNDVVDSQSLLLTKSIVIQMPIYDYLFRYERGAFWMGRPTEFTWSTLLKKPLLLGPFLLSWKYTRFLFGRYFTATILYRLLHVIDHVAVAEKFLIQDAYIPSLNASKFVQFVRQNIPITVPIWLCPVRRPSVTQPLSPNGNFDHHNVKRSDDTLINVGVWGRVNDNNGIRYMQNMEHEMLQYNGRKMLYSITAASQMSYETLYEYHINGTEYLKLRTKYEAQYILPPIHEKLQLLSSKEIAHQNVTKKQIRSWKYWLSRWMT